MIIPEHKIGDKVICPVCQKQYIFSVENAYIISGDYACDWKCFMTRAKTVMKEKETEISKKKK